MVGGSRRGGKIAHRLEDLRRFVVVARLDEQTHQSRRQGATADDVDELVANVLGRTAVELLGSVDVVP